MEYDEFVQEYNRDPSPYILKPPLAARGEGTTSFILLQPTFSNLSNTSIFIGIRMAATLDDVDVNSEFVQKKIPVAQKYACYSQFAQILSNFIVTHNAILLRYITNPLLFYGHKMTFRLYVVVTSLDPLRIYVYNNGLVRICSQKCDLMLPPGFFP